MNRGQFVVDHTEVFNHGLAAHTHACAHTHTEDMLAEPRGRAPRILVYYCEIWVDISKARVVSKSYSCPQERLLLIFHVIPYLCLSRTRASWCSMPDDWRAAAASRALAASFWTLEDAVRIDRAPKLLFKPLKEVMAHLNNRLTCAECRFNVTVKHNWPGNPRLIIQAFGTESAQHALDLFVGKGAGVKTHPSSC